MVFLVGWFSTAVIMTFQYVFTQIFPTKEHTFSIMNWEFIVEVTKSVKENENYEVNAPQSSHVHTW